MNPEEHNSTENSPPTDLQGSDGGLTFSLRDGMYMPFMYKGHQIVIHQSTWTFREKMWVDDQLVVNELGYRMSSTHTLPVDGEELEVSFGYNKGASEIFVNARAGDEVVYQMAHNLAKSSSNWWVSILLGAAFGFVFGYLVVGSLLG